jgi:hypothetical protein
MFYRLIDPAHPRYDAALAKRYGDAIEKEYERMDATVAAVLEHIRPDDTLLILSDNGFHGYRRGLHVNQWLRRQGLLALKAGAESSSRDFFLDVDWPKTKAYALGTGQDWWGALPDLAVIGLVGLLVGGIYITNRVNKMPMVLVFLGVYFVLFTVTAFVGDAKPVAEIFRQPDANMALFFAFFILTDPPTSPAKYRDQMICGAIVAASSFAIFQLVGAVHYLLSGVLVGNVWEAWRRHRIRARRAVIG